MLRINNRQFAEFRAREAIRIKAAVTERMLADHPDLEPDREGVAAMVDQLFEAGFETRQALTAAAGAMIRTGLRTDPDAAEARALCSAILLDTAQGPDARLTFFRQHGLDKPPKG
ncbi:hypothetical protein [Thetidibacter halocola]|uniref:Uncharacterized protein n=1 Tax=Thetidibacter halocola TaxID=2827239 RepID=A0A8J8B913_9RHOB|nr:hypothetical protein [Thetidibacter halocola]MBS0126062.1 hypothetical protein [Thetidibacter halocola]